MTLAQCAFDIAGWDIGSVGELPIHVTIPDKSSMYIDIIRKEEFVLRKKDGSVVCDSSLRESRFVCPTGTIIMAGFPLTPEQYDRLNALR